MKRKALSGPKWAGQASLTRSLSALTGRQKCFNVQALDSYAIVFVERIETMSTLNRELCLTDNIMCLTVFAMPGPEVLDVAVINEKVASSRIEQRRRKGSFTERGWNEENSFSLDSVALLKRRSLCHLVDPS